MNWRCINIAAAADELHAMCRFHIILLVRRWAFGALLPNDRTSGIVRSFVTPAAASKGAMWTTAWHRSS